MKGLGWLISIFLKLGFILTCWVGSKPFVLWRMILGSEVVATKLAELADGV